MDFTLTTNRYIGENKQQHRLIGASLGVLCRGFIGLEARENIKAGWRAAEGTVQSREEGAAEEKES